MATESQRKKNFFAYYEANPSKLKGRSIHDAYAAMRREAGRQKKSPAAADRQAGLQNAAARRAAQAASGGNRGGNSPLARGAAKITGLPGKFVKNLPSPGFGSDQSGTGRHGKAGINLKGVDKAIWKAGESGGSRSSNQPKPNKPKYRELSALEKQGARKYGSMR